MAERLLAGLVVVPFLLGAAAAPVGRPHVVFTFQDSEIVESSGLAVAGDLVVTTNDSGDTGRVFAVDPSTGRTVGTTAWSDDAQDVEALAAVDAHEVWVGDIGDNLEHRSSIQVTRVPVGRGHLDAGSPVYDLVYPDGAHDAETLLCDPDTGRLYVATKSVLGGTLYAAPEPLDPHAANMLQPMGDVLPIATDGTFVAGGTELVIRNYAVAAVYAFPSLQKLDQFPLPVQPQGEGIALEPDGSLLLSSEGLHSEVLRVSVPAESSDGPTATPTPSPSSSPSGPAVVAPATTETHRPLWPWLVGGLVGGGCLVAVALSLRRR